MWSSRLRGETGAVFKLEPSWYLNHCTATNKETACVHINNSKYFPASAEHSFLQSLSQQLGNTQHTFIYKQ